MTNFQQLLAFGLVGALSAAAHYSVLVVLVETARLDPTAATTIGFLVGAGVNYILNHRYVFSSTRAHIDAAPRFLAVAAATGLLNTAIVHVTFHWGGIHYLLAQVISTAGVFLVNFTLNRLWTFRERGAI